MLTPIQFEEVKREAYAAGAPRGAERAIVREYLQCEVLAVMSALRHAEDLALIGGTGLRLLYNLDRFSEDLDFDYCGATPTVPVQLITRTVETLSSHGYAVSFRTKRTRADHGGGLVFSDILFSLALSSHRTETLVVKFEYTTPKPTPERTTALLSRFGFVTQVTTEPLSMLCARKIAALFGRKRTQPRDLYDLTWFLSRRILPDVDTLRAWGLPPPPQLTQQLLHFLEKLASRFKEYERDIVPLLLNPAHAQHIHLLPDLVRQVLQ